VRTCGSHPRSPFASDGSLAASPKTAEGAHSPERPGTPGQGQAQPRWSINGRRLLDVAEYEMQAQYSAARILRHLALDGDVRYKAAVQACLPSLVHGLQVILYTSHRVH
jgi:hypothetical protein